MVDLMTGRSLRKNEPPSVAFVDALGDDGMPGRGELVEARR
jgi:hypothetical protein